MSTLKEQADRFHRSFKVKLDGTPGSYSWVRGDRPKVSMFEPAKGTRGGRRGDGFSLAMVAYYRALGDQVALHTIVAGKHREYVSAATPAQARAYLEYWATLPGFNLMRGTAQQWLDALNKAETVINQYKDAEAFLNDKENDNGN